MELFTKGIMVPNAQSWRNSFIALRCLHDPLFLVYKYKYIDKMHYCKDQPARNMTPSFVQYKSTHQSIPKGEVIVNWMESDCWTNSTWASSLRGASPERQGLALKPMREGCST